MAGDTLDGVPLLSQTRYQDLHAGQKFGPFVEPLSAAVSSVLRGELGTERAGAVAPAGVLPLVTLRVLRRALSGIPPGGVLLGQSFDVQAELPSECTLDVAVVVSDKDERDGRLYTTFRFTIENEGVVAALVDWTIRDA